MSEAEYRHLRDARRRMGERRQGCRRTGRIADWLADAAGTLLAGALVSAMFWLCCAASGYHWD